MSNHAPTRYGMAKRVTAAAKPGATKNKRLPAKKKKLLVAEVHKEDQDILAKALEALWKLLHFNEYPIRAVQNGSVGLVNFKLIFLLRRYLMTMKLSRYLIPFFLKCF